MDRALKTTVCKLVAGLIISDEDLSPEEDAFLDKLLAHFGFETTERDVIFPLVDGAAAAADMRSLPQDVQAQTFELLLDAAAADGQIVDEEREFLRAVAGVLSITDDEIETRLAGRLHA